MRWDDLAIITLVVILIGSTICIPIICAIMYDDGSDDSRSDEIYIDLEGSYLSSQDDNAYFAVYPGTMHDMDGYLKTIIHRGGHIEHVEMPDDNGRGIIIWTLCEIPTSE